MTDPAFDGLSVPDDARPSAERVSRMEQARQRLLDTLAPANPTLSTSPLGVGWSSDLDVYVSDRELAKRLASAAGWVDLESVLRHLGYPGECSYAITDDVNVLAKVDINPGRAPAQSERVIARAERLARPDVRAVLEIRQLVSEGLELSSLSPKLKQTLAEAEGTMSGRATQPATGFDVEVVREDAGRPRLRRPQIRLAVSGVDGSGKSTLVSGLEESLGRLGIPFTTIWTRPGMGLARLDRIASWVRRLRKEKETTGLRRLAEGESTQTISSRRGVVGWVWLMLVSVAYLADVRGQARRAKGVVIFDRHLLDALGTIEAIYEGVPSGVHRWLVRRFVPDADFTVWLDIDPEEAAARKPDDLIGADLVAKQALAYREYAEQIPRLFRHAANNAVYLTSVDVLNELNGALSRRRLRLRNAAFTVARRR